MDSNNSKEPENTANEIVVSDDVLAAVPHLLGAFCILSAYLGFLAPLFFWLAKKDEGEVFDREGRKAINFQAAYLFFSVVSSVLVLSLHTVLDHRMDVLKIIKLEELIGDGMMLIALAAFGFSLLVAYKTYKGVAYKYPASLDVIRMFRKKEKDTPAARNSGSIMS